MDLEIVEHAIDVAIAHLPHVIGGIVVLIVGWAAGRPRRALGQTGETGPGLFMGVSSPSKLMHDKAS